MMLDEGIWWSPVERFGFRDEVVPWGVIGCRHDVYWLCGQRDLLLKVPRVWAVEKLEALL
jgi:hypothetical protein